jgi:hypothetical protein
MKSQNSNRSGLRLVKSGVGIFVLASALIDGAVAQTNTKLGAGAGASISTGNNDTAIGAGALTTTTTGSLNTALGSSALRRNTTGASNVGVGYQALYKNITGGANVGIGNKALTNNTSGSNNIGIGNNGGSALTGSNNIAIGNPGVGGTSGTIKIGTVGVHTKTLIAGEVGIGLNLPVNPLDVEGNGGDPTTPDGHVASIRETGGFAACLALRSGFTGLHTPGDNFITFFDLSGASIGSIEGNGAGSVQLSGAGSDYAEYLPKADPSMKIDATQIVGVRDGKIVSQGQPADQFMIVTGQAIIAGNRPSEDANDLAKRSLVSFIGQVPVQVRGQVASGDFILASEKGDGTGIALPASKIDTAAMPRVVGRAWEASKEEGLKTVNTAVGLDQTSLVVPALQRLEKENQELRERMERLEKLLLEKSAASGLVNSQQ